MTLGLGSVLVNKVTVPPAAISSISADNTFMFKLTGLLCTTIPHPIATDNIFLWSGLFCFVFIRIVLVSCLIVLLEVSSIEGTEFTFITL